MVDKNNATTFRPLSRTEAFNAERAQRVEAFLDRNGYTVREVRGIAHCAVVLWETQKVQ